MTQTLLRTRPFEIHASEYDEWFDKYSEVFESEVEAIRDVLPQGNIQGIEVGLATGRFSVALGIKEGVEPTFALRKIALSRGIEVIDAVAEKLPYKDLRFDFVVMCSCISYFYDMHTAFIEASRVLKPGGSFIIGFIEKDSKIGKQYEYKRQTSTFYKQATFYSTDKIIYELKRVGFKDLEFSQTLFKDLDQIKEFEPAIPGYGNGSFVVIKAIKK